MPRNTVDRVAAAVVRRLQADGRRTRSAPTFVSPAAPQLASSRRGRKPPPQTIDILARTLASAVTRRLATGSTPSGIPLSASRLTRGIVRTVGRQLGRSPGAEPVALGTIDPAAAAKVLTDALDARRAAPVDPAAIVTSKIVRRLNRVRLVGTPVEARAFQASVAASIVAALRPAPPEATAVQPVAEPAAAPAEAPAPAKSEPAPAPARK